MSLVIIHAPGISSSLLMAVSVAAHQIHTISYTAGRFLSCAWKKCGRKDISSLKYDHHHTLALDIECILC